MNHPITRDVLLKTRVLRHRLRGGMGKGKKCSRAKPSTSGKCLELLRSEREFFISIATSIGCATFYQGAVPEKQLLERIATIIDANPWLAGRLITDYQCEGPVLWVPDKPCSAQCFKIVEVPTVYEGMPYRRLNKLVVKHGVKPGFFSVDADCPIFRVTILRSSPECFVLTMSLSHAIADGDTFYQIYRMLDKSQPIKELQASRVQSYTAQAREFIGSTVLDWQVSKRTTMSYLWQHFCCKHGFKKIASVYEIDADWLAQEKKECAAENSFVPFVSSNDVITSEIFKLCDIDFGMMALNMRTRLQGINPHLAGNYVEPLGFFKEDIAKGPVAIRQALAVGSKALASQTLTSQPSILQTLGMRFGTVSNWASFHVDVELDGCEVGEHYAVFDEMGVPKNTAVIFSPQKGSLAIMVIAGRKTQQEFKQHPGLREKRSLHEFRTRRQTLVTKSSFSRSRSFQMLMCCVLVLSFLLSLVR